MLIKIKCGSCGTDTTMSMVESSYKMPFRCWKCKEYFTLIVENNAVVSLTKLSADEYAKLKEAEDARKFKRQF